MSWKPAQQPSRFPDWVPERLRGVIRWSIKWGLVALTLVLAVSLFYLYLSFKYNMGAVAKMPERTLILDRNGKELATMHGDRRRLITREEIPDVMVEALLAREDKRFFEHGGVDVNGLARATLRNIKDRSFTQGASTLTMQLTRNSYDLRAKSIHRKLLEIAVTVRIERSYSKDDILTHYLNRIYFGSGCHGVEEAAQTYFGRSTNELNIGECALLVGIIRGPHLFSPFRNIEGALVQRDEVLARMMACDYLSESQMAVAKSAPIRLVSTEDRQRGSSYVKESIRRQLNVILDQHDIRTGGLRIHTTLDGAMQQRFEKTMASRIEPIELENLSDLQAAAVKIDPQTGGILALCGGRDFSQSAYNRVYRVHRDLGPMFTPFLQAIALERAKVVIPGQMLQTGRQLGVPEAIRLSERLGFSGPFAKSEDLYRGIIAASPIELVNAASALVSHGTQYEPHLIAVISNMDGQVLYESSVKVSQVVSKDTASDALEMMELENGMFYTPTASRHDAWGLSINDDHVTALWLGYDQSKVIAAESALKKSLAATLKKLD